MKSTKNVFLVLLMLALPNIMLGAGVDNVNSFMENVYDALYAAAMITVTVVIMVVAYKVLIGGQALREFVPVLIGAVLLASATEIATLFFS